MRRADRLFQIIQALRGASRPVTAATLGAELDCDRRTIYRDIAALMANGVPIRGEAGVGYVLEAGYELPPLMLTVDEIEAALLGAQWVTDRGDPALANGARDLIAKLRAVLPANLERLVARSGVVAPNGLRAKSTVVNLKVVRAAIREQAKLLIDYEDEQGERSERRIWPILIAYFETLHLIVAWCELRAGFRHFRADRIRSMRNLGERFLTPTSVLRREWERQEREQQPAAPKQA